MNNSASNDSATKTASGAATVAGMGACYALGTFTDNFYKQAAILLAAATQMGSIQSTATVLFSLPFVLCSAWAGWLADKLPKQRIVVAAKTLELAALCVGGLMLVWANWAGILAVVGIMGLQATIFSPAINGSIPENFPDSQVPRVNSLIKLASTAAILAGMAAAGFFLDMRPNRMGGSLPDGILPPSLLESLGLAAGDGFAYGRAYAAGFVILMALLGLGTAFTLRKRPAAVGGKAPAFPWTGPLDSLRHALDCRKDRELFTVLMAEAIFYGVAAIAVISIANLAASLGLGNTLAGLLTASLMSGIAVGSLLAGKGTAQSWRRLAVPSAVCMAGTLLLISASPLLPETALGLPLRTGWMFASLFVCGIFGGLYLIPLASFIQVRPKASEKGKIVAVSNFVSFLSMAVFGAAFQLIGLLPPALTFTVYALVLLLFSFSFLRPRLVTLPGLSMRDAASGPLSIFLRAIISLRYSVTEQGLDDIPLRQDISGDSGSEPAGKTGTLFLPNHPALIDPIIIYSRLAGLRPRPLADEKQMSGFAQKLAGRLVRAVIIPDIERDGKKAAQGVREGIDAVTEALRSGDNVLLYPSGRVYRSARESLGGNSAVARILDQLPDVRIVLARTTGLWGSSFSHAEGTEPGFMRSLLRGVATLAANAFLFMPRRKIRIEFREVAPDSLLALPSLPGDGRDAPELRTGSVPQLFDSGTVSRLEKKTVINRHLESYYNESVQPATAVPRFFWQGSTPVPLPEIKRPPGSERHDVSEDLRKQVYDRIRIQAGFDPDLKITAEQNLRSDLFMDSLGLMDLATALENEFGHEIRDLERLHTVEDCVAAAAGLDRDAGPGSGNAKKKALNLESWFATDQEDELGLTVARIGDNLAPSVPAAFLHLARKAPGRPLAADSGGVASRRRVLTGALALVPRLKSLPGKRLGIMLPATPAALVVWLAAMLAGKEPVLLNWTLGARNLRHCIALAGISHAVSARPLLEQLDRSGAGIGDLPLSIIAVDALAKELTMFEKARAACLAALHCSFLPFSLGADAVPETAAILFTSGSEAAPKAVPLSQRNVMTNASDVAEALKVRQGDRLLAMLPPFHSFGLLAGLVLPAASGLAAAYHPNPTESGALVRMARDFKPALLGATPTFLEAMLQKADADEFASLRYAFVGAEKCPDRVYRLFAEKCPAGSLCEGYGITECSPVVAVNRPGDVLAGSIGRVLPSVRAAVVVDEGGEGKDTGSSRKAATNETGMLLVRGPSIFAGYLAGPGESVENPFVRYQGESWYRTGDLVSMDDTGRLFFQGRLKRFVKIGGEMLSLPLMENVLQEALANRFSSDKATNRPGEVAADGPGSGASGDEQALVAVETLPGSEQSGQPEILAFSRLDLGVRELNAILREAELSPIYSVKRVIRVPEIPLLGTGKTDYRALQRLATGSPE